MRNQSRTHGVLEVRAARSFVARKLLLPVQAFIHTEQLSSGVLLAAAVAALLWANSPWRESYVRLWETVLTVDVGLFAITEDVRHWVNDALMVLFFFVVGMEIKRELVHGELSDWRRAALPTVAALGGMVVPALIYLALNAGREGSRGWGVPMATDIAFALGVLTLLGERIPAQLRILLLALAIVDDIGAILVIAVFYSEGLSFGALAVALLLLGVIVAMRHAGVLGFGPYFLVGALIWVAVLKSGVHATLAGVVLGLLTPASPFYSRDHFAGSVRDLLGRFEEAHAQGEYGQSEAVLGQFEELSAGTEAPLNRLERILHPWSSYVILPLFALANAGVALSTGVIHDATSSRVTWGIVLGLLIGKLTGVTVFAWVATRLGLAALPAGVRWSHLVGVSLLAGIGFTVSLFITGLAFDDGRLIAEAKIGILAASVLAGLIGYASLRTSSLPNHAGQSRAVAGGDAPG